MPCVPLDYFPNYMRPDQKSRNKECKSKAPKNLGHQLQPKGVFQAHRRRCRCGTQFGTGRINLFLSMLTVQTAWVETIGPRKILAYALQIVQILSTQKLRKQVKTLATVAGPNDRGLHINDSAKFKRHACHVRSIFVSTRPRQLQVHCRVVFFDEECRTELFPQDQIPMSIAYGGYVAVAYGGYVAVPCQIPMSVDKLKFSGLHYGWSIVIQLR